MAIPNNPIELAREKLGPEFYPEFCGPVCEDDVSTLRGLNTAAIDSGFLNNTFWVETNQGIVMPKEMPKDPEEIQRRIYELPDLTFAGRLVDFHKFSIAGAFGAWCLRFDDSTLIPGIDKVPEQDELWVPTNTVKKIEPL